MANRVEIPIVVLADTSPTSPVAGASAVVKIRGGSEATVYSDSGTTNNPITQPLTTDSAGRLTGWLPRGAYEVVITVPGKNPYTEYMDVAPGSDGAVDTAWIAPNAVTGPKIAEDAVEAKHIKENAVGASEIIAGGVGSSELGPEAVETGKIKNLAITEVKIADGATTSRKAKLTAGVKVCTEDVSAPTFAESLAWGDVPGAKLELAPSVPSILLVRITLATRDQNGILATIKVDAESEQTAYAGKGITAESGLKELFTASQDYEIPLTAATHTIQMRIARPKVGLAGVLKTHTRLAYQLLAA